jgi:arylsulfatase A-like enzyme
VLLIITDIVGFAAPSTFRGVNPTPTLDRIANNGLRFTQFHTTSLCSPPRAALITGRNHHSVASRSKPVFTYNLLDLERIGSRATARSSRANIRS